MKFTAREDISAPIEYVFGRVTDADGFERRVRQRGGQVRRTPEGLLSVGTSWTAQVTFRGKVRKITGSLVAMDVPERLKFSGGSGGMDLIVEVELIALSPQTTRLSVVTEAKPKSLAARLAIQSAKLARGIMTKRYKTRVADYAATVEKDYRTS